MSLTKPIVRRSCLLLVVVLTAIALLSSIDSVGAKRKTALVPPPPAAPPPPADVSFDFDGDGKADIGRWHKENYEFKVKKSSDGSYTTVTLGSSTAAKPAPGDYDGDGDSDPAVFNAGTWTYRLGSTTYTLSYGSSGDVPVCGDYDGDGDTDFAYFRPSNYGWYVYPATTPVTLGYSGVIPVPGDYDGDGATDMAVFRPTGGSSDGYWYINQSSSGATSFAWGIASDVPLQGDFDDDGMADPTVYRLATGTWYSLMSSEGYTKHISQAWGSYADQPAPADYDGDGKTDYCVWRPTTGVWHAHRNDYGEMPGEPPAFTEYQTLGVPGDMAVESAYIKQIGGTVTGYDMATARLAPKNATGGTNLYSQNFSWSKSLVSLPGRAGLDANFGIGYNSLVWIKKDSAMYFDPDASNVSPGFRFGFPVIEPVFYDAAKSKWTYMMVTPDGARQEFRQIGASASYEAADSTYAMLTRVTDGDSNPNDPVENISMIVTTTDGTAMTYQWYAGAFRCTKIRDRNGNYISMTYDESYGLLSTVTDTLGREITVSYDSDFCPTSITQTWKATNGSGSTTTHTWASFTYTTATVTSTNFGSLAVYGPPNDTVVKVLQKVTYADGSYTKFLYNGYIQVKQIENYAADNHELNRVRTNLDSVSGTQSDCPRFTHTYTRAENFNMSGSSPQEVDVENTAPASSSFTGPNGSESTSMVRVTVDDHPTNDFNTMIHYAPSGYKEGLILATEDCLSPSNCTGTNRVRWTWTDWTQDNTGVSYITNPRVIETRVGDGTNTKRTTITYFSIGGLYPYGLPELVKVYDTDLSTVLKTEKTVYNHGTSYLSRRIIGLPLEKYLYQGTDTSGTLMSKVTHTYDGGTLTNLSSPTQHATSSYGTSFTYRGNLTETKRWDATSPTNGSLAVASQVAYNIAGSPVSATDPRGRVSTISYTDSFNSSGNPTTYAYPTTVTDAGGFSSTIKYRYDIGANVEANSPAPEGAGDGKNTLRVFSDTTGRIERETVDNTDAYTRYVYANTGNKLTTYSTIVNIYPTTIGTEDEVMTETIFDGAGRTIKARTENPDSTGGWSATKTEYDILGRVFKRSVPTEVSVSGETWTAAGDDSSRGFVYSETYYDWKGRVTRTIPSDSTGSDDKDTLIEYAGCGCAGGQVTTIKGPKVIGYNQAGNLETTAKRRMQKAYEDILGRTYKTEVWDFYENSPSTPYSTTKTTFNGRDQATLIRQYVGADTSSTYQDTTFTYDGHGRVSTSHKPEWFDGTASNPTYTTTTYNADDTVHTVTDPRGAVTTYTYENYYGTLKRPLVATIAYAVPSPNPTGIVDTPDVNFTYDAAGNRQTMEDGSGSLAYEYDELSRLVEETKHFDPAPTQQPTPGYVMTYQYHLGGSLKSITDPFGYEVNYSADKTGRTTAIGDANSGTRYATGFGYRAFGAIKSMSLSAEGKPIDITMTYDSALRPATYEAHSDMNQGDIHSASYSYHKDGMLNTLDNSADPSFDQASKYDFAGRMKWNELGSGQDRPFNQTMAYDQFSNLTSRSNYLYDLPASSFSTTYTNNRPNSGSDSYDRAGNTVSSHQGGEYPDDKDWAFDAAGRSWLWHEHGPWGNGLSKGGETVYDGDGRAAKQSDLTNTLGGGGWTGWVPEDKYNFYSSVTGQKISEADEDGAYVKTNVYLGSTDIARQDASDVMWKLTDPITGGTREVNQDGTIPTGDEEETRNELAGLATSIPAAESQIMPAPNYSKNGGWPGDPRTAFEINGGPVSPSEVSAHLRSKGAALASKHLMLATISQRWQEKIEVKVGWDGSWLAVPTGRSWWELESESVSYSVVELSGGGVPQTASMPTALSTDQQRKLADARKTAAKNANNEDCAKFLNDHGIGFWAVMNALKRHTAYSTAAPSRDDVGITVAQAGLYPQAEIDRIANEPDSQGRRRFQEDLTRPLSAFIKTVFQGKVRAFVSHTYSNTVFYRDIASGTAFHEAVHLASGNLPDIELAEKLGLGKIADPAHASRKINEALDKHNCPHGPYE